MAKDGDMSLFNDVLEPFRRVINTDPPKDKLSASTKLNFSDSNQSLKEGLSNMLSFGKRKSSIGTLEGATPEKRIRSESASNSVSTAPSPWEAKRMKIDLIAAKAQITKLEARVAHQHTIRKEMQILFEEERASLEEQHKRDERALSDMEDRLQVIRRREQELKDELAQVQKDHQESKATWAREKAEFQKQVADLKDQLLEAEVQSKGQLSEMKRDMSELQQAIESYQSEVEILKKEVAKQTTRAEQCTSLRTQLEKQTFELQQVTSKLKELEYERDSYQDWTQQAKTAQNRLFNMADLEKEVGRLRANERGLRDAICNKLLLEEQVHVLTNRVEALQPVQQELHKAKVKIANLESSLEEWKTAAQGHGVEHARALSAALDSALAGQLASTSSCSQAQSQLAQLNEEVRSYTANLESSLEEWKTAAQGHGVEHARALSAALDSALTGQLASTSSCSQAQSQLAQLNEELATMKFERDKATTKLEDLITVKKNQETHIHRLQKRLLLVTRERDSYRQQLDCYEKELTVTLSGETGADRATLLSARVTQLEKALQSYRDLLAAHDSQGQAKVVETLRAEVAKWREEAESLRLESRKMRSQRDSLQAHFEKIGQEHQTKVLHLTDNPAAAAQKQFQLELENAQEEIKRLKALLSAGAAADPEDLQQLRQQIDNSKIKLKRMKEEFTSSAQEYRNVVYMLLGYKIDRTGHKNYRISHMYAESPEDYLSFTLCDDEIEMVHTEYSASLSELVELHLHQHRSIPVFLSALTMELFTRTTMQQEVQ